MAPDRRNRRQFGVAQVRHLGAVVVDLKVQVVVARHQQHAGADRRQRLGQIALVQRVGADVAGLPGAELREQIGRVAACKVGFPGGDQIVFERRGAQAAPHLFAIESLRQRPAGIDPAHGAQAAHRPFGEHTVAVSRIRHQRVHRAVNEDPVVRRTACRSADHRDALDGLRKQRSPVVGLHPAHRPAVHQRDLVDAPELGEHATLHVHRVEVRHIGIARADVRPGRVRRRARQAVAEQIGDHDEVFRRIERAALAHHELRVVVLRAVRRRIDDHVRAFGIQRAEGLVDDRHVAKGAARLQHHVAGLVDLSRMRGRADGCDRLRSHC